MAEISGTRGRLAAAFVLATVLLGSAASAQIPPPPLTPAVPSAPEPALTPSLPTPPLVPAAPQAPTPPLPATAVVRVGILASTDAEYRLRQAEPFRAYLAAQAGVAVEMLAYRDFDALIDAQVEGLVQYAVYSGTAFVTAEALCSCVEPIAAPADADGALGFHSILLARADSAIATLEQARGARLALVSGNSVAGRLVPLDEMKLAGIVPADYFSALVDVASPEAAIAALLAGEVDVAVAWSTLTGDPLTGYSRGVLTQMVGAGALTMDRVRVVWQSALIPYGPHAVRSDTLPEVKAALASALAGVGVADPRAVDAIDQSGVVGFVTPDPGLYDPLRRLVAVEEAPAAPAP